MKSERKVQNGIGPISSKCNSNQSFGAVFLHSILLQGKNATFPACDENEPVAPNYKH